MQSLQQMRDGVLRLETEFASVPKVVERERAPRDSGNRSPDRPGQDLQSAAEKARTDAASRRRLLRAKKLELEQYEQ